MPVGTDLVTPLWRAVVILRVVTAAFAVSVIIVHQGGYARPELGWGVLAGIVVWTVLTCLAYSFDVTRRIHVIVLDLVVTLALIASSVLVLSSEQLAAGTPLLTTIWATGPVLAAAVHAGRIAGMLFGVAVCAVAGWARGAVSTDLVRDSLLLVGAGFVVGLAATTARRATDQLRRAARAEAAMAERERLARSGRNGAVGPGEVDLASALQPLAGSQVHVAVPAAEVPLPAGDVEELVAIVREALADVDRDATTSVLVEDLGDEVVLTVRDDVTSSGDARGPGDAQHSGSEADGRLGMSRALRGRVADLGGTLTWGVGPGQGTGWEVRLARTRREL